MSRTPSSLIVSTIRIIVRIIAIWGFTLASSANGYSNSLIRESSYNDRTLVRPLDLEEIQSHRISPVQQVSPIAFKEVQEGQQEIQQQKLQQRYDLGIGKNLPVHSKGPRQDVLSPQNYDEWTRYLVDHQSTREYPSPMMILLRQEEQQSTTMMMATTSTATTTTTSPKRVIPKVKHERRSTDVLRIDHDHIGMNTLNHHSQQHHDHHHDSSSLMEHPTISAASAALPFIRATTSDQLDLNTIWVELMLHSEHIKSVSYETSITTRTTTTLS